MSVRSALLSCPLFAALLLASPTQANEPESAITHPLLISQPERAPDEVELAVEIPAGSITKYEIGADGLIRVDRFQSMPVAYPGNYGALPSTLSGDGDALDALVLTRTPLYPGVLIRFRPIGVLRMADGGDADEKIIGVPTDQVDPSYTDIRDISDLPAIERERIETFFRIYKDLPATRKSVKLDGLGNAAEARNTINAALQRYRSAALKANAPHLNAPNR